MVRWSIRLLLTTLLLTGAACNKQGLLDLNAPTESQPASVRVTVTIDGEPAFDVTVHLTSAALQVSELTTTGLDGTHIFSGLLAATYTVTISGFPPNIDFPQTTQTAEVTTAGQTLELTFAGMRRTFGPTGSVYGLVRAERVPVPGVQMSLTNLDTQQHFSQLTDASGHYEFTNLDYGRYEVRLASDLPEVEFPVTQQEADLASDSTEANFDGYRDHLFDGPLSATLLLIANAPLDPYVFNAGPRKGVTIDASDRTPTTMVIQQIAGFEPCDLPELVGTANADGLFEVSGAGLIAGVEGVEVRATGRIVDGRIVEMTLTIGPNGELPLGGQPVVYDLQFD